MLEYEELLLMECNFLLLSIFSYGTTADMKLGIEAILKLYQSKHVSSTLSLTLALFYAENHSDNSLASYSKQVCSIQ